MKNIHVLPTDKPSRLHLWTDEKGTRLETCELEYSHTRNTQNIYITNKENKKIGDYVYDDLSELVFKITNNTELVTASAKGYFKVILTDDIDLIKDGVQAIDDEFLEWFVQNPSCEEIEVSRKKCETLAVCNCKTIGGDWKIIIPKEEPKQEKERGITITHIGKQETLEEVRKVERTELFNSIFSVVKQIPRKDVDGDAMDAPSCAYEIEQLFYKWQQEQDLSMVQGYLSANLKNIELLQRSYSEEEAGELVYNIIGEYAKQYGIIVDGAKLNDLFERFKKK